MSFSNLQPSIKPSVEEQNDFLTVSIINISDMNVFITIWSTINTLRETKFSHFFKGKSIIISKSTGKITRFSTNINVPDAEVYQILDSQLNDANVLMATFHLMQQKTIKSNKATLNSRVSQMNNRTEERLRFLWGPEFDGFYLVLSLGTVVGIMKSSEIVLFFNDNTNTDEKTLETYSFFMQRYPLRSISITECPYTNHYYMFENVDDKCVKCVGCGDVISAKMNNEKLRRYYYQSHKK